MDNLSIWDAVKQPPKEALKTIQGGRLKGKTDINPQWRYKVMTEQFGPCGIGWKYTVEKVWLEPAGDEICAFAMVHLYIKEKEEWSAPIPGIGGSMLLAKETSGLHVSDEAYKMAITDALSVALKMIGVAADIYAGLFDGSKYNEPQAATPRQTIRTAIPPKMTTGAPPLANLGELYARAAKFGLSPGDICQAAGVIKGEDIIDWDEAWIATAKKFTATIKASQVA